MYHVLYGVVKSLTVYLEVVLLDRNTYIQESRALGLSPEQNNQEIEGGEPGQQSTYCTAEKALQVKKKLVTTVLGKICFEICLAKIGGPFVDRALFLSPIAIF